MFWNLTSLFFFTLKIVNAFYLQAQKLGIIKDFTLTQCDDKHEELSVADDIISQLLKKIQVPTVWNKTFFLIML